MFRAVSVARFRLKQAKIKQDWADHLARYGTEPVSTEVPRQLVLKRDPIDNGPVDHSRAIQSGEKPVSARCTHQLSVFVGLPVLYGLLRQVSKSKVAAAPDGLPDGWHFCPENGGYYW